MKYYLKIIAPIFAFVAVYSLLSILFGQKGFFAAQQLKQQRDVLITHVQMLSDMGENLAIRIANLSSDPETIAVYAHELGYVHENERLIKLLHFSGEVEKVENPGAVYTIEAPRFLSDNICKSIALSVGLIVVLCEILIGRRYAYFKNRTECR
ncbi:MAG: septum formation initiator family protein [Treponema sp.]